MTIAPGDFDRWLDCRGYDAEQVMTLLTAPEEGEFAWHEVSTRVNRVANDDAQLVLPITAEQMRGRRTAACQTRRAAQTGAVVSAR